MILIFDLVMWLVHFFLFAKSFCSYNKMRQLAVVVIWNIIALPWLLLNFAIIKDQVKLGHKENTDGELGIFFWENTEIKRKTINFAVCWAWKSEWNTSDKLRETHLQERVKYSHRFCPRVILQPELCLGRFKLGRQPLLASVSLCSTELTSTARVAYLPKLEGNISAGLTDMTR